MERMQNNKAQKNIGLMHLLYKGFTMVEIIVVVAIIAVLTTVAAIGVTGYLNSADKNERDHAAETAYLGMQDYLNELKKTGELELFNKSVSKYCFEINQENMRNILLNNYNGDFDRFYEKYKHDHDSSVIVALVYNPSDKSNPIYSKLFEILGNEDTLEHPFVIEYNQTTGIVQAVFYSKSVDSFTNSSLYSTGNLKDKGNILLRDSDSLDAKKQGYYGILYTATYADGSVIQYDPEDEDDTVSDNKPVLDALEIDHYYEMINGDRIYIHIRDVYDPSATYKLSIIDMKGDTLYPFFGGGEFSLSSLKEEHDKDKPLSEVLDQIDLENNDLNFENGVYLVSNAKYGNGKESALVKVVDIYFVVYCDHHNAREELIINELEKNGYTYEGSNSYDKTFIVAQLEASTDTYINPTTEKPLGELKSDNNAVNPIFQDYINGEYTISCARQLNNIREYGSNRHYRLVNDINLYAYEREEEDPEEAYSKSERHNCHNIGNANSDRTFETLRCHDGNGNPVAFVGYLTGAKSGTKDINQLAKVKPEDCYYIKGFEISEKNTDKVGFITTISPETFVGGIVFDSFKVEGHEQVGAVAGYNQGTIVGVFARGVESESSNTCSVSGYRYIGGIVGYSDKDVINCGYTGDVVSDGIINIKTARKETPTGGVSNYKFRYMGGVAGYVDGRIIDCYIDGTVNRNVEKRSLPDRHDKGDTNIGGVVGYCKGDVEGCIAYNVKISGYENVGGLVGRCDGAYIKNCKVVGNVQIDGYGVKDAGDMPNGKVGSSQERIQIHSIGGLIGFAGEGSTIIDCLVGSETSHDININANHYSEDDPYAKTHDQTCKEVGGLAGTSYGKIENCQVHINEIKCFMDCGGICGKLYGEIKNSDAHVHGALKPTNGCTGLIVGVTGFYEGKKIVVENCNGYGLIESYCNATDKSRMGGIVGSCDQDTYVIGCTFYGTLHEYKNTLKYAGGIIGNSSVKEGKMSSVYIIDCVNDGTIISEKGFTKCGGIVGCFERPVVIRNCVNKGTLKSTNGSSISYTGGLSSELKDGDVIENSRFEGLIESDNAISYTGGLAGTISFTTGTGIVRKDDFISEGRISANKGVSYTGGVAGIVTGNTEFIEVYSAAKIHAGTSTDRVGMIIGEARAQVTFNSCTVSGNLTANTNLVRTGGLVGRTDAITTVCIDCESTVSMNAGNMIDTSGGLAGELNGNGSIDNCRSSIIIVSTGQTKNSGGLVGKYYSTSSVFNGNESKAHITAGTNCESVGGYIGLYQSTTAHIKNHEFEGSITVKSTSGTAGIGGIIGTYNGDFALEGLSNRGSITSEGVLYNTGGIVGTVKSPSEKAISFIGCNNYGDIRVTSTAKKVGGIAGYVYYGCYMGRDGSGNSLAVCKNQGKILGYKEFNNSGSEAIGGLVGYISATHDSYIVDCTNEGHIGSNIGAPETAKYFKRAGGIIGEYDTTNGNTLLIESCTNKGDIYGESYCGGIIACNTGDILIRKCTNNGTYYSYGNNPAVSYGGIIGLHGKASNNTAVTTKCILDSNKNIGSIVVMKNDQYLGGIIGKVDGNVEFRNENSFNGNIETKNDAVLTRAAGGIGYIKTGNIVVENIKVKGDIVVSGNAERIGGIVGQTEVPITIKDCRYEGKIEAAKLTRTGGVIGNINKTISVDKCNTKVNFISRSNIQYIGGIMGYGETDVEAVVEHSTYEGKFTASTSIESTGGIIGRNIKKVTINDCDTSFDMNADTTIKYVGGILGYGEGVIEISDVSYSGKVTAKANIDDTSGVLGRNNYVSSKTISTKITDANVQIEISTSGTINQSSGIIGYIKSNSNVTVDKASAKVSLKTTGKISNSGGIIGKIETPDTSKGTGSTAMCNRVASEVDISAGELSYVGGIVGTEHIADFTMTDSHSSGDIICSGKTSRFGTLVGSMEKGTTGVTRCYSLCNVSSGYYNGAVGCLFGHAYSPSVKAIKNNYYGGTFAKTAAGTNGNFGLIVGESGGTVNNGIYDCYVLDGIGDLDTIGFIKAKTGKLRPIGNVDNGAGTKYGNQLDDNGNNVILAYSNFSKYMHVLGGDKNKYSDPKEELILYMIEKYVDPGNSLSTYTSTKYNMTVTFTKPAEYDCSITATGAGFTPTVTDTLISNIEDHGKLTFKINDPNNKIQPDDIVTVKLDGTVLDNPLSEHVIESFEADHTLEITIEKPVRVITFTATGVDGATVNDGSSSVNVNVDSATGMTLSANAVYTFTGSTGDIKFKLEPSDHYSVEEVSVDGEVLTPSAGEYSKTVSSNCTITVKLKEDPKANIKVEAVSDNGAVLEVNTGNDDSVNVKDVSGATNDSDNVYVGYRGDTAEFEFTIPDGCDIDSVSYDGNDISPDGGKYKFTIPDADTVIVKVKIKPQ